MPPQTCDVIDTFLEFIEGITDGYWPEKGLWAAYGYLQSDIKSIDAQRKWAADMRRDSTSMDMPFLRFVATVKECCIILVQVIYPMYSPGAVMV